MVTYISHHLHHWRIWPYLVNTRCQIRPCNICSQWCRQCLPSLFISLLWHHWGWRIQSCQCLQTSQSALGPRCASSSCASRGIREWGYSEPDEDGEALVEWASNSDLTLTHDAKQHGTFYWARWQKDYSPDLCWVTSIGDYPQPVSQTVLGDFPHSQHRPLLIHIGLQLPIIYGSSKKRWNFRKADWNLYSSKLERSVVTIPSRCIPIEEAYQRFQGAIFSAATTAIPRGCRPVYTPCLDVKCQALLEEYEGSVWRVWKPRHCRPPNWIPGCCQTKPMGRISGKT